jgi:hypothetical protein
MAGMQIFVQSESAREIHVLELSAHATVRELVGAAQAHGIAVGNGSGSRVGVYSEDAEAPLSEDATLEAAGLGNLSSVHLSRCKSAQVTVHYNGQSHSEMFGPGVPMHRVKRWAVGKKAFDLAAVDAAEHVLQITGTSDRPDEDVHIGSLVGSTGCTVEFDLVAKVRVEG